MCNFFSGDSSFLTHDEYFKFFLSFPCSFYFATRSFLPNYSSSRWNENKKEKEMDSYFDTTAGIGSRRVGFCFGFRDGVRVLAAWNKSKEQESCCWHA